MHCLDEATGKVIWTHKYPVKYTISYPAGPRCTPTVDGDMVYTLGAEGQLICFNIADGKIVWEKNLPTEYKAKSALWGYSAHPLIDGDMLLTLAGGREVTSSHWIRRRAKRSGRVTSPKRDTHRRRSSNTAGSSVDSAATGCGLVGDPARAKSTGRCRMKHRAARSSCRRC